MALNTELYRDRLGFVKLLTIIVGIILIGFIGHSYYNDSRDEAYLSCAIICFIISLLWALATIMDLIHASDLMRKIDMLYHMIAFVFYILTVTFFFISLIKYSTGKHKIKHLLWERVFAFILGVINTVLYGFASYCLYSTT